MEEKNLIPAPIDEKHVSLDFLGNVFDEVIVENGKEVGGMFKGEYFQLKHKPTGHVLVIKPTQVLVASNWWDLYAELNEIFSEDYGANIVVDIENEVETGSIYLWFYLKV